MGLRAPATPRRACRQHAFQGWRVPTRVYGPGACGFSACTVCMYLQGGVPRDSGRIPQLASHHPKLPLPVTRPPVPSAQRGCPLPRRPPAAPLTTRRAPVPTAAALTVSLCSHAIRLCTRRDGRRNKRTFPLHPPHPPHPPTPPQRQPHWPLAADSPPPSAARLGHRQHAKQRIPLCLARAQHPAKAHHLCPRPTKAGALARVVGAIGAVDGVGAVAVCAVVGDAVGGRLSPRRRRPHRHAGAVAQG